MEFLSNSSKGKKKIALAARDWAMLLLSTSTAMRGDNICPILLSDLYTKDILLVDVDLDFNIKVWVLGLGLSLQSHKINRHWLLWVTRGRQIKMDELMSMVPYDTAYQRSVQSEQLRFIYFCIVKVPWYPIIPVSTLQLWSLQVILSKFYTNHWDRRIWSPWKPQKPTSTICYVNPRLYEDGPSKTRIASNASWEIKFEPLWGR